MKKKFSHRKHFEHGTINENCGQAELCGDLFFEKQNDL